VSPIPVQMWTPGSEPNPQRPGADVGGDSDRPGAPLRSSTETPKMSSVLLFCRTNTCGRGEPSPGADVADGEPSPRADVGGVSLLPVQMWAG
jgi:hypothetical protein